MHGGMPNREMPVEICSCGDGHSCRLRRPNLDLQRSFTMSLQFFTNLYATSPPRPGLLRQRANESSQNRH